jgi:dihydroorotase
MTQPFDLIIRGGIAATVNGIAAADIGVRGGRIAAIGRVEGSAPSVVEASGLHVLPGIIDTQVHFREPGLEHKEDIATGTTAAVLGGVTTVFEMPNTNPNTLTAANLADKLTRARGRARADIAFFIGAAESNFDLLATLERLPGCAGIKLFMGSSTGSLLVAEDDEIATVLRQGQRRVAIHAEDEARLRQRLKLARDSGRVDQHPVWRDAEAALLATQRALTLAAAAGRRIHVLHVSTAAEMRLLGEHKDIATVEVTPQHLTLAAPGCYEQLGTLAQMNPPIRDEGERACLWQAVQQGIVDCLGSDHAPHTLEEKAKPYPTSPSGMPGVQTLLPVMLDHVNAGRLTLERLVDLTSAGPARVYGIAGKGRIAVGYDADLTLVDLGATRRIENRWIASRCGWTPFDGVTVKGWPVMTMLRGAIVMHEDTVVGGPRGQPVRFTETLG